MPIMNVDLLGGEAFVQLTGVLQSTDGGKTWIVVDHEPLINLKGESLSVDLHGLILKAAADLAAMADYTKFHDLAEDFAGPDAETMAESLKFWYRGEKNE
jgi:hypothetical protein